MRIRFWSCKIGMLLLTPKSALGGKNCNTTMHPPPRRAQRLCALRAGVNGVGPAQSTTDIAEYSGMKKHH